MKKLDHISHSQIQLGRCPYAYKQIRLEKKFDIENDRLKEGSLKHEVIYEYTKECIKQKLPNDFELMDSILNKKFKASGLPQSLFPDIRKTLIDWAEKSFNYDTILEYECEFEQMLVGGVSVKGIIDRMDAYQNEKGKVLEITDYKNTVKQYTKSDVNEDLQLKIYKFIACNYLYRGFNYVRVGVCHLRHNFTRWSDYQEIGELASEFESIENMLNLQWDRLIEADDYPCERGAHCYEYDGCPILVAEKCPAHSKKEIKKMMGGSIEDQVRALRKLTHDVETLKKTLKAHFTYNSPMVVDGAKVGFEPKPSYAYKWPIVDFLQANGADMEGVTISKTEVEKRLKNTIGKIEDLSEGTQKKLKSMMLEKSTNNFVYK